ncbi:cytochrome b562 [Erwinia endophytica]|uniref:cytochrome b562 n=1 Tax=Erwinia endophytica TaxID=1563158 RepID=UPI001265E139|nr:cytochrome b562 [Erwinia endophytica]KAB8311886.1 cytochrome b562 [Erwinia endophytica]
MRKTLLAILTTSLLCSSLPALADLADDMAMLQSSYFTVTQTDNVAEFKQALTEMRGAAEDGKKQTPDKLKGQPANSPKMQDFRAGFDTLIGQIDASMQLANAGNMAGAKEEAKKFAATRDANHKKFR